MPLTVLAYFLAAFALSVLLAKCAAVLHARRLHRRRQERWNAKAPARDRGQRPG